MLEAQLHEAEDANQRLTTDLDVRNAEVKRQKDLNSYGDKDKVIQAQVSPLNTH